MLSSSSPRSNASTVSVPEAVAAFEQLMARLLSQVRPVGQ
jgi:hypothetical protein